jgi:hypothetical protein
MFPPPLAPTHRMLVLPPFLPWVSAVAVLLLAIEAPIMASPPPYQNVSYATGYLCSPPTCPIACHPGARFPADLSIFFSTVTAYVDVKQGGARPCFVYASADQLQLSALHPGHTHPSVPLAMLSAPNVLDVFSQIAHYIVPSIPLLSRSPPEATSCTSKRCSVELSPYLASCICVCPSVAEVATFELGFEPPGPAKFSLLLLLGLALVILSPFVAKLRLFYYLTAGLMGVVLSIALIAYLVSSRVSAKRYVTVPVAAAFQALSISLWSRMHTALLAYQGYVLVYASVAFLVCTAVVHQYLPEAGPPPSRVRDVFQYGVELAGHVAIVTSTPSMRVGLTMGIVSFTLVRTGGLSLLQYLYAYLSSSKAHGAAPFQTPVKPGAKRRLLSEDEYARLGQESTSKALREHMQSPQFLTWLEKNAHRVKVEDSSIDQDDDDGGEHDDEEDDGSEERRHVVRS